MLLVEVGWGIDDTIFENISAKSVPEKFVQMEKYVGRFIFYPIALLIDWLMAEHLTEKIVLYLDMDILQTTKVKMTVVVPERDRGEIDMGLYCDNPNEEEVPNCPICFKIMDKLGQQIVKCYPRDASVTFGLTSDQVKDFHTTLTDNNLDQVGLKIVKECAAKCLSSAGFFHMCTVCYIEAGPGCGKSYLIN